MSEELAVIKQEPRHTMVPRAQTFAPTNLTEAIAFADMIAKSDLAPRDFKGKPGNVLIAMQMGAEVGLSPLQALQNIAVINGRPCLWGDAALGVVQSHPGYEGHKEFFEGTGDTRTAVFRIKRKGQEWHETRFTVADAKKARLWGKEGPWQTYPDRMLQQRARGFGMRDQFSDALRGLITAEEAADIPPTMDEEVRESLRQSRREVERGTLEVSKEQNRGHGNEGFGASSVNRTAAGVTVIENGQGEVIAKSVEDRVVQASTPTFNNKPEERARPKSDKPAAETEILETQVLDAQVGTTRLSVKQVEENKTRSDEEKHQGAPYYKITCIGDVLLYVYDQHLFRAVLAGKGKKKSSFVVQRGAKGLLQIKDVIHVDGVKFARDPVSKDAIPADLLASTEKIISGPETSNAQETASETKSASTHTAFQHGANSRYISAEIASVSQGTGKSGRPYLAITVAYMDANNKNDPHMTFYCHNPVFFPSLKASVKRKIGFEYSVQTDAKGTVWQTIEGIAAEDMSQEGAF